MKKILAVVLALTMIVGMSIPAFAARLDATNDTTDFTVGFTFVGSQDDYVIAVDVEWDTALTFTYNQGGWDPENLVYKTEGEGAGTWDAETKTTNITVSNKSNKAIDVAVAWTATLNGADATIKVGDVEQATDTLALVDVATKAVDSVTFAATVDVSEADVPTATTANIGKFTVTITA